ncbi:hypothetical protein SPSIL_008890 [Sporomusa silvacetica DSM 10669]|uniref:HNH endonuclease n=1 Tax=Sporomusa silvacetica DSM 10669 TaxID=1123289 RepID=A0ABZ3IGI1_9FIRM|nr:hypothetical protein [Sporomusa silvacetica]OZC13151.1 hypothetical protein SPSIL_56070 [Sporomusa silvacetica DSM 10669]
MLQKRKKVRLTGKPLAKLNNDIHERDDHTCIIDGCGRYVSDKEKFHHEPQGNDKEDRIECGALLCYKHHIERHRGMNSAAIRQQCVDYLQRKYSQGYIAGINSLLPNGVRKWKKEDIYSVSQRI